LEFGGNEMKNFVIWLTGIPSSGKSSIALSLRSKIQELTIPVEVLDSDDLRNNIHPNLSYSEKDREIFYNSIVYIAKLLVKNNINVIIAATANRRKYREKARKQFENFIECYVKCPVKICIKRDPKGLYKAAMNGKKPTFPIFIPEKDDPLGEYANDRDEIKKLFPSWSIYEIPKKPDCVVDTSNRSPEENAEIILKFLKDKGFLYTIKGGDKNERP
jgi:adenylylsulfate kinase